MAVIKGTARQAGSRQQVSEGAEVYLNMLRDGTIGVAEFKALCVMAGYGFTLSVPAAGFSTGQKNDGTVVDIQEPNWLVSIPNGKSIMPIRIIHDVQGGAPTDGQELETLIAVDQDSAGAVLTNMTAGTIYNMNTLCGKSSGCLGYVDSTDSITDPVLDIPLARATVEFDIIGTATGSGYGRSDVHLHYEPVAPPIINGPACLIGYWGGDTAVVGGFAIIEWLEFPESLFAV